MTNGFVRDTIIERYMVEVSRHPLLTREQEISLAKRYRAHDDLDAAHQLVVANLRFVVKVAREYRGYKMDLFDIIQEGNIGLMIAVRKFDPARGFRLITYAIWWIRAKIHEFIIRSWSLVKLSTGRVGRMLFFKQRLARETADRAAAGGAAPSTALLARQLEVAESDIRIMQSRLAGRDSSLDSPIQDGAHDTRLDLLSSPNTSQEDRMSEVEDHQHVRRSVFKVMKGLNESESYIVNNRLMTGDPKTLQEIGRHLQVSRERARQIEGNVLRRIRTALVEGNAVRHVGFSWVGSPIAVDEPRSRE